MKKTTFEKLAEMIERDTGLKVVNLKRTYAGINQRASGAFVWSGNLKTNDQTFVSIVIGGTYHATELVKCKKLSRCRAPLGIEIVPADVFH